MPSPPEIRILKSSQELFEAAAAEFAAQASEAIRVRGKFTVALSGGSTPKRLYSLLATRPSISWDKICFFWGDERHVPPDHTDSNYRMANEALLSKVPVRPENIFRIRGEETDADAAALQYEVTLQQFFQLPPGEFPRFDLILLGLGPDGHCASLFPDTSALSERRRLVVANWVEKLKTHRITFTFPVLNQAACVIFLASGPDKAPILHQVLENTSANLPSQHVRPIDGKLLWLVDSAAASDLSGETTKAQ
ncbi:MAG: 6-phosphogluconolactonase [Candidatus Angelobacter sp.]